ncbi:MAG: alpha-amylase family protein, partial [Chthoniobacterales bacterium]
MKNHTYFQLMTSVVCLFGFTMGSLHAETWKIEAEKAGDGSINKVLPADQPPAATWVIKKVPEASEGALLGGVASGESHPIPLRIPQAGKYYIWVRHYTTAGKPSSITIVFRDQNSEVVAAKQLDFQPRLLTAKILKPESPAPANAKPTLVWSHFETTFERPMEGSLSFGMASGVTTGTPGIDAVVISDDAAFSPEKTDVAKLPAEPGPLQTTAIPAGMKPAQPVTDYSGFFAGISDPAKRFEIGVANASSLFIDYAWLTQLGINHDHGWTNGSTKYGIDVLANPFTGYKTPELAKAVPAPTGRYVNANGQAASFFSRSYKPYRDAYLKQLAEMTLHFKDRDDVSSFMLIAEDGGPLDYSDASKQEFHKWLPTRFESIAKLNELWRTNYKSFDEIPIPQPPKETENKAPWFAFREFSGLVMANAYAEQAKVIVDTDPKHRNCSSQASCLHVQSPGFTSTGSVDFEDLINIAFANQPEFGMDAYSTGDYFCGSDMDLLLSLGGNRRIVNNEFNVHGQDPRVMARTFWGQIGKGIKGITAWTLQSTPNDWIYDMWGMLNPDFTPRDKFAAMADASHEAHHLERLLYPAKPTPFVKPIAMYYSRLDLSLTQPTFGIYSSALDSPYRIYGILRGLGYPVRWITPRQIEAGHLKDVAAVVMIGTKYVPSAAAKTLAQWVKGGGALLGDSWPGVLDEYDRPQTTLLDVFGIRPTETAKVADKAKAKMEFDTAATPVGGGIDPEILRTLNSDELFKRVEESWNQWDSTHPVAKAVGNWHLSGFDLKKVTPTTGEVIGMGMGSTPGGAGGLPTSGVPMMVINDFGKGHALYSAIMMGTLYEAGPLAYEWDSSQEGPGIHHILGAFLSFCGIEPFAEPDLPERLAWKTRIEMPLVDAHGNVVVGLTSLNDTVLPSFPLTLIWPVAAPKLALACIGGSRRIEKVPFEVKDGKLTTTMPAFDSYATFLGLTNSDPLIGLEFSGVPRGAAGL